MDVPIIPDSQSYPQEYINSYSIIGEMCNGDTTGFLYCIGPESIPNLGCGLCYPFDMLRGADSYCLDFDACFAAQNVVLSLLCIVPLIVIAFFYVLLSHRMTKYSWTARFKRLVQKVDILSVNTGDYGGSDGVKGNSVIGGGVSIVLFLSVVLAALFFIVQFSLTSNIVAHETTLQSGSAKSMPLPQSRLAFTPHGTTGVADNCFFNSSRTTESGFGLTVSVSGVVSHSNIRSNLTVIPIKSHDYENYCEIVWDIPPLPLELAASFQITLTGFNVSTRSWRWSWDVACSDGLCGPSTLASPSVPFYGAQKDGVIVQTDDTLTKTAIGVTVLPRRKFYTNSSLAAEYLTYSFSGIHRQVEKYEPNVKRSITMELNLNQNGQTIETRTSISSSLLYSLIQTVTVAISLVTGFRLLLRLVKKWKVVVSRSERGVNNIQFDAYEEIK